MLEVKQDDPAKETKQDPVLSSHQAMTWVVEEAEGRGKSDEFEGSEGKGGVCVSNLPDSV